MGPGRTVLVAGAGASGLAAAVFAARAGARVIVIEKGAVPGKKLSMTGNGRCNLSNMELSASCYNPSARMRLKTFLERFGTEDTVSFFGSIGVLTKDEDGLIYPYSGEAATVTRALVAECGRLGVRFVYCEQVKRILRTDDPCPASDEDPAENSADHNKHRFTVRTDKGEYAADSVIMATGGLAGPRSTLSAGDGYFICAQLGMESSERFPALTGLMCDDIRLGSSPGGDQVKRRQVKGRPAPRIGVRCAARIRFMAGSRELAVEEGELQITEDGISGIPVMQASAAVVRAMSGTEITAYADLFPEYDDKAFNELSEKLVGIYLTRKSAGGKGMTLGELTDGIGPALIGTMVLERLGLNRDRSCDEAGEETVRRVLGYYRAIPFVIRAPGSYERAQVTSGGVLLGQLDDDLQSRTCPGVYVTGELLDVDGRCGGYNLQWAWMSGAIAGTAAAKSYTDNEK